MKIVAYICAFNEADILPWVLDHLISQGVEPYVIDNWSTDETQKILEIGYIPHERFPAVGPSKTYDWHALLRRVEELARETYADWVIHHDADEIRRSPWPDLTLAQAIERVDSEGYNAVDHRVFNFRPIDNGYAGNPEQYFRMYEPRSHYDRQHHIKAWRKTSEIVDLATSGGHQAWFEHRRVYPEKFILKHYPVRSQQHGERKILKERIPRYREDEKFERGWHVHADELAARQSFLWDSADLIEWQQGVACSR